MIICSKSQKIETLFSIMSFKSLSNIDIHKVLGKDIYARPVFKGVFPRDKLPNKVSYPAAYVVNTDKSNESGEHWLAIYYDSKGECTFFDSFGQEPKYYGLQTFLEKTSKNFIINKQQVQSLFSNTCGHYCIFLFY